MRLLGYQPTMFAKYQVFACDNFGQEAYQGTEGYIRWLYDENPCTVRGETGMVVAVTDEDNAVVGCLHTMQLEWRIHGRVHAVPTVHDIMVSEDHRTGLGAMLLMKSIGDTRYAFVAGATPPFTAVYRELGWHKMRVSWYRRILTPLRTAMQLLAGRTGVGRSPAIYFQDVSIGSGGWTWTTCPGNGTLECVAHRLNRRGENKVAPTWTTKQLYWRFFHPFGPRHLMIYRGGDAEIEDFCILSLGPRKGLALARVVEIAARSQKDLADLLDEIDKCIREFGAHALSIYCGSRELNIMYESLGWKNMTTSPDSYFFSNNSMAATTEYSTNGSAADIGFEAIRTVRISGRE